MLKKTEKVHISAVSTGFFAWITPFLWRYFKGKNSLGKKSFAPFVFSERESSLRFSQIWTEECTRKGNGNGSLAKAWFRFVQARLVATVVAYLLCLAFGYLSGLFFLRNLMNTIKSPESEMEVRLCWAVSLISAETLRLACFSIMQAIGTRTEKRTGWGLYYVLYKKLFTVKQDMEGLKGTIINLFSNDVYKVVHFNASLPLMAGAPVIILTTVCYTWWIIGKYALIGIVILAILVVSQWWIARLKSRIRKTLLMATDERVGITTEALDIIKLIKFNAWEDKFCNDIKYARKKEHMELKRYHFVQCFGGLLTFIAPSIMTFLTITSFTVFEHPLDAVQVFTIVMVNYIAAHGIQMLPIFIRGGLQAKIAFKRIQEVLNSEDRTNYIVETLSEKHAIVFESAVLSWEKIHNGSIISPHKQKPATTLNVSMKIPTGELCFVVGNVGSGKTSFLKSLLGQMELLSGKVAMNGTAAFVSQEPWLMNSSVRDNIIFGKPFDRYKYLEALYSCSLLSDIATFPNGDMAQVSDSGLNLSGGQKQRITLARAIYSDSDVYLLDDPLSAVDEETCRFVFQQCIRQALKGKTVLLVTSQLQYVDSKNLILLLDNKAVQYFGTYELFAKSCFGKAFKLPGLKLKELFHENCNIERGSEASEHHIDKFSLLIEEPNESTRADDTDALMALRKRSTFHQCSRQTYFSYCKILGGSIMLSGVVLIFAFGALNSSLAKLWLGYSVKATNTTWSEKILWNLRWIEVVYGTIIIFLILSAACSWLLFAVLALRGSTRLHNMLLDSTFKKPMEYFEKTSLGHILNLFAHDVDEVDNRIPTFIQGFLQKVFLLVCNILVIVAIYPWFILAMGSITLLFLLVYQIFRKATKDLKRFENSCKTPVITKIRNTVSGLLTIKSYKKEDYFLNDFEKLIDLQFGSYYLHACALKWFSTRTDFLCVIITSLTVLFAINSEDASGIPFASLAIVLSMQLCRDFQAVIRMGCNAEASMISTERILTATNMKCEKNPIVSTVAPENWSPEGKICFSQVFMEYNDLAGFSLKNISFCISPKEKIAIVGTTGAGKSSIVALLFKLIRPRSGAITIDDVDIANIDTHTLRLNMTIIPQQPALFRGTIRSNLDPFSNYTDDEIYRALEITEMRTKILQLPGQLDSSIIDGKVFSGGEKQLLCLARAVLKKSKIIVLDEPTSLIDHQTDAIIANAIRDEFSNSTVLTITHRLQYVTDYNRIMIIRQGEVVDFDSPENLVKKGVCFLDTSTT